MLTQLRREVQAVLALTPTTRKPALRRTDDPQALLMTDLPRIAEEAALAAFTSAMEASGWRVVPTDGWLLLDKSLPAPPYHLPDAYDGELGCCLWLLRQHPGTIAPPEDIRALLKAAEQGPAKVERLCKQWHSQWSDLLRTHRPLPGGLLPYLAHAKEDMP